MAKLPTYLIRWPDAQHGPWLVELRFRRSRAGRWELSGLSVELEPGDLVEDEERTDPAALTTTLLRQLPISTFLAEAREFRRQLNRDAVASGAVHITAVAGPLLPWPSQAQVTTLQPSEAIRVLDLLSDAERSPRSGRPTFWSRERLAEVADVYREAWAVGDNPTRAVAARFSKSESMAAKLVTMCRLKDLLPATSQGKALGTDPRELQSQKPTVSKPRKRSGRKRR